MSVVRQMLAVDLIKRAIATMVSRLLCDYEHVRVLLHSIALQPICRLHSRFGSQNGTS